MPDHGFDVLPGLAASLGVGDARGATSVTRSIGYPVASIERICVAACACAAVAQYAVATALAMKRSLVELNTDWRARGMTELAFGIGINHGEAIVGNLGSSEKMELTVIGDAVNLASRLQGQAAAGEVLISEEAHRRTRDWLSGQRLTATEEALQLKGLDQPVKSFRLRAESWAPASS